MLGKPWLPPAQPISRKATRNRGASHTRSTRVNVYAVRASFLFAVRNLPKIIDEVFYIISMARAPFK
jgi:hypothetical protein